jgi:hypothetical protein
MNIKLLQPKELKIHCMLLPTQNSESFFDMWLCQTILGSENSIGIANHSAGITKFSFHPNPSTSSLIISLNLKHEGKVSLQLITTEGKLLREINMGTIMTGENILNFDVSGFSTGNYFLRIISPEGIETKKVIIE